eukprot:4604916-Prymnesium_polylepis.1
MSIRASSFFHSASNSARLMTQRAGSATSASTISPYRVLSVLACTGYNQILSESYSGSLSFRRYADTKRRPMDTQSSAGSRCVQLS